MNIDKSIRRMDALVNDIETLSQQIKLFDNNDLSVKLDGRYIKFVKCDKLGTVKD